ncbi:MAG: AMP-dependent synthetase, partial [Calditrichaeota bacterium]|nr:AMP-dependent synthetase [Calditrichota bacterium]
MSDSDNFPFGQKSVWEPNPQWIAESNIQALMNRLGLASYEDLYRWSIADVGRFWETVLRDLDIRFYQP